MIQETIVALSTAPLESAIALIRMSGTKSLDILNTSLTKPLSTAEARKVHLSYFVDITKQLIDQVVVTLYIAPHSFTGEDMVEISCHGSMLIVEKIIASLVARGAQLATRGEFSQRAFLNGKIDLIQAEAINDLIIAKSATAHQLALTNLGGKVSNRLQMLKSNLMELLAHMEVNIDYPEYYDIEQLTHEVITPRVKLIEKEMDLILKDAEIGQVIRNGIKTAIVGQTNVGKSSLLNALIKENKAIVTDIAGTTRDIVEGTVSLGGLSLHLMDTAGIRDTADFVEKIGVKKSIDAIENAQLVIVVLDASKPLDSQDSAVLELTKHKQRIIVSNKIDKGRAHIYPKSVEISATSGDISLLEEALFKLVGFNPTEALEAPLLTNSRQLGFMKQAYQSILQLRQATEALTPIDLLTVDLHNAIHAIQAILGEVPSDRLDEEIFSRFCIGK